MIENQVHLYKSILDSKGQTELFESLNNTYFDSLEEKLKVFINQLFDKEIGLSKSQKRLYSLVKDELEIEGYKDLSNLAGINTIIESCIEFRRLETEMQFLKVLILEKMKRSYEFSYARRRRTFVVPTIKDELNHKRLEFNDEDKDNWHYWKKHRTLLESKYIKSEETNSSGHNLISRIDRQTDHILRHFKDPRDESHFLSKGLVIGHVQSGKTANFMGLISKACSIGYRFIIILSGTKNDLRRQTQNRFDQELSGWDRYGLKKRGIKFADWQSNDALKDLAEWELEKEEKPHITESKSYWRYRSITALNDFDPSEDFENFTDLFNQHRVVVAVVKKHAIRFDTEDDSYKYGGVLGKLSKWILGRTDQSYLPPTLIIDDEADQASVDGNADKENLKDEGYEPATINGCIQTLLRDVYGEKYSPLAQKRQLTLVGYTATPFANVFISNQYDVLYPSDFIVSLDPPENYFGMDKYFGSETRGLFIDNCTEEEAKKERKELKDQKKSPVVFSSEEVLPKRLITAFHDFIFYSLVKDFRGIDQEKTMLIHASRLNVDQEITFNKLYAYGVYLLKAVRSDDDQEDGETQRKNLWDNWLNYAKKSEQIRNELNLNHDWPDYSEAEFLEKVNSILTLTKYKLVNGLNDNLDYYKEDLNYVVAVGGDILSRGLTLEGLAVSYYMRNANNYDSLLQMARWFGYRIGYEDLIRVYTSEDISMAFEHLLLVEKDLREEIKSYEREGLTPNDFAPKVRAHMRMKPSGRMGVAKKQLSFSGQIIQTHILKRKESFIRSNYKMTTDFINQLANNYASFSKGDGRIIFNEVEASLVVEHFIRNYEFGHTETRGLKKEEVLQYLEKHLRADNLETIDVVISGRKRSGGNENLISEHFGSEDNKFSVLPVRRGNIRTKDDQHIFFGAISNPADFDKNYDKTILAIYFIDTINSIDKEGGRVFDNAIDINPVSFAIGFPHYGDAEYWRQEIFKL